MINIIFSKLCISCSFWVDCDTDSSLLVMLTERPDYLEWVPVKNETLALG